ncbi:PQQ-binding-like beta-propeller repeat protein [Stieleria sp. ICT_E10.1]|uniref:outer membrane protein assembly factor BamB family protein n=1 Tax=Stieleria sedimenti TaxID=2976331 RepID=UPI0021807994|nr:PQQ-binding-like beta-propeller repeat protein [Stieleria sedimenti]MCS7466997.1 PQQ-binding-like beta-propeller repeat protein [Stieleria sedimenti]
MIQLRTVIVLLGCIGSQVVGVGSKACAQPWPTYRHDARRSGVTDASLTFPMQPHWVRVSQQPPQTAWTGPAKWDAYSGNSGLQSMRNFDPCFFVTVDGDQVFFGSSVDDAVHALDVATGKERWVFFTGSAVRFPPTLSDGRAFFGSDDGFVYCCDQSSGELIWKRQAAPERKQVASNRKLISMWPVRTGVLVQDGTALFGASLVPWKASYLCKVDAMTGALDGDRCFRNEVQGVTMQGALLASSERIYVPQGRAAPLAFEMADGSRLGAIGEAGGVFCVLTEDEMLLAGPQDQKSSSDQMRLADARSRQRLATFSGTNRILVAGERAWIPTAGKLKMLNRSSYVAAQVAATKANGIINDKKRTDEQAEAAAKAELAKATKQQAEAWRWEVDCPNPTGFIKTADSIVVGLENEVRAYDADDGTLKWSAEVDGVAHGLAVADGRLLVSTGLGHIYAFGSQR